MAQRRRRRLALLVLGLLAAVALGLAVHGLSSLDKPSTTNASGDSDQAVSEPPLADIAAIHEAIFELISSHGMDAGRYVLDARRPPQLSLQAGILEVGGELSLLNTPHEPWPYYAIIEQSGPVTSVLLLRVDGEVVYRRAER